MFATRSCPRCEAMDGCIGMSLMVDRETGRCIVTSAWESEDAMRASAEQVASHARPGRRDVRRARHGPANGRSPCCTATTAPATGRACARRGSRCRRDKATGAIDLYRDSVLPALEELEGFCSASLLVDRSSGRAVSSVTFDSVDAMDRNREQARSLRTARLRDLGADQLDVGEFELAIAHLRVPELA